MEAKEKLILMAFITLPLMGWSQDPIGEFTIKGELNWKPDARSKPQEIFFCVLDVSY